MARLLLLTFLLVSGWGAAQICNIDYSQTSPGIYPDTMPVGYVNQPYDEDITFVMPLDTQGFDFTNFHILSIGLPVGLNWQCNNATNNCNYDPQTNQYGCVNVFGTPLLAGQYQVDVTVIADLTIVQGVPTTFSVFLEILPDNVPVSNNGFSMAGANGCAPQTVDFTNNNPGLLAYQWDFGNGNTSTLESPTPQVYTAPGDYIVNYQAWTSLDTTHVYTLTDVSIQSMSGYGEGFPSFEVADPYYIIFENGNTFSQSSIIANTDPPVSWTTSQLLDPANTYTIEIWESDSDPSEILLGADDYMGVHTINLNGCAGCAAGSATISYTINHQVIYPTPAIVSVDTIHISGLPTAPPISYDSLTHTLSANDLGDSYQWYFNGSPVAGATDTTHVVMNSGYYHLVAINAGGCVAFSDTLLAIYCSPNFQPTIEQNTDGNLVVTNVGNHDIQWYMDGSVSPDDTLQILVPNGAGDFYVVLTDEFGCSYTSDTLGVTVGLQESILSEWKIYPNPASNYLMVESDTDHELKELEVIDLMGRVVFRKRVIESKEKIDLTRLKNGTYWIRLNSQGIKTQRAFLIRK